MLRSATPSGRVTAPWLERGPLLDRSGNAVAHHAILPDLRRQDFLHQQRRPLAVRRHPCGNFRRLRDHVASPQNWSRPGRALFFSAYDHDTGTGALGARRAVAPSALPGGGAAILSSRRSDRLGTKGALMNRRLAVLSILPLLGLLPPPAGAAVRRHASGPSRRCPIRRASTVGDGPLGRPVRRLLHLLLRQVAGQEPDPRRPVPLERLRQAGRRQPALPLGDARGGGRPVPGRDANTQKIGDYFASCMDEAAIEKAGIDPLEARSGAPSPACKSRAELAALLGRLHPAGASGQMLLRLRLRPGPEERLAGDRFRRGRAASGLPDREYYLKDDAKSQGDPRALPRLRARSSSSCSGEPAAGSAGTRSGAAPRDRARQGVAHPRRAPRPLQDRSTR